MKRSLASTSTAKDDDDDFRVDLSGYHTSDETDDEGWDLGPPACRASDVSDDEGWDLGPPPVDHKSKKVARIPRVVVDDGEGGHLVTVTPKHGKPRQVYASYAHADGTLRGGCHHQCRHQFADLALFAPATGSHVTAAKRTQFVAVYEAYKAAFQLGDRNACRVHRATLEAMRTACCAACKNKQGRLSDAHRACKEWYDTKRQQMCALNNGCANAACPERGPDVWCILTADHGTNPKATNPKTNKKINLSSYTAWPPRGGVPAMEKESEQICKWICHVCHRLEPSSNSGKRLSDPNTMPKGKHDGTELEIQQYKSRHMAMAKYPKHLYVDAAKRRIGCCAACNRPVTPDIEVGFEFDHIHESTKSRGGLFGPGGGVAGLVNNPVKAASLERVRELLDVEMSKCQLLCSNCHARKTCGYPASTTVF